jgi:hypothetical protein
VTLRAVLRQIPTAGAMLLLAAIAWGALSGGVRQIPESRTLGQRLETGVQLACGVLSLLGLLTCFWWRRTRSATLTTWTVSLVTTAFLSSLVWGPPSLVVGLALAALTLLVAQAIIWLLRTGLGA